MVNRKWINETGLHENGKRIGQLDEYLQWNSMRGRCSPVQRRAPCYIDCTCHTEWESYDVYIEWARQQIGFLNRDDKGRLWQLDKDILLKGNKVYSARVCVFVPSELNKFVLKNEKIRGVCPLGVCWVEQRQKYRANIKMHGLRGNKHLGYFDTPTEAFQAYKVAKESYAKQLAIKYTGLVDPRVIDALNNFTVNIDD